MLATRPLIARLHSLHIATTSQPPPAPTLPPYERIQLLIDAEKEAAAACADEDENETLGSSLYDKAATDGELLDEGVIALLDALRPPSDAVFADLGSGRGGALFRLAAAHEWRHAYGVELIGAKHAAAEHTLAALQKSQPEPPLLRSPVSLLKGDVIELESLAAKTTLSELTHAYTCSVCFDDFLLRKMAKSLGDRKAFPRFQALVSLRQLPSQPHLTRIGSVPLACSWNAAVTGHCYVASDLLERDAERDVPWPLLERMLCDNGVCALPSALQPWPSGGFVRLPS